MAYIWRRTNGSDWLRRHIERGVVSFDEVTDPLPPVVRTWQEKEASSTQCEGPGQELATAPRIEWLSGVTVRGVEIDGTQRWVLLSAPDARVRHNGTEVLLGLAILRDRDEIVLRGLGESRRFYFSTEQLAEVVPAPAGLKGSCARCKDEIAEGSLAVRCPACGAWHHQSEGWPCWTHIERCGACHQQETLLDGQLQWSPEEL